ncbi:hypothetical protein ACVGVM_14345 [Pseudonocardia bannensis]|uniref:Uncharacterized protein n=1 Tax=Pseudonocardia bannensis TaxID=630973 RepID=A0A848DDU2_9PSEU|nr:hypothetical protein [Pseudonocardia bannensis]NMH90818.1 hypothetical protein [Pseudonocardia bannensis]
MGLVIALVVAGFGLVALAVLVAVTVLRPVRRLAGQAASLQSDWDRRVAALEQAVPRRRHS